MQLRSRSVALQKGSAAAQVRAGRHRLSGAGHRAGPAVGRAGFGGFCWACSLLLASAGAGFERLLDGCVQCGVVTANCYSTCPET